MSRNPSAKLLFGVRLSVVDEGWNSWIQKPADVDLERWEDDLYTCIGEIVGVDDYKPRTEEQGPRFDIESAGMSEYCSEFMGFTICTSDWDPSEVDAGSLTVQDNWEERIREALVKLGAPQDVLDTGASWWLLPYYG